MGHKTYTAAGDSRKGAKQSQNDDRFIIRELDKECLLIGISDGMGGHPAGYLAAETVIATLNAFEQTKTSSAEQLAAALYKAEEAIKDIVRKAPALDGMGATATAVLIDDGLAKWAHVGDCRFYLLREGILQQISRDHSFLQYLIEEGRLTPAEALKHPMAHVLDQCIGCLDEGPEYGEFPLIAGDRVLLCTDGLYNVIARKQLIEIALQGNSAQDMVASLLDAFDQAKGKDDATALATIVI